mgnify:CR=1 FL=1
MKAVHADYTGCSEFGRGRKFVCYMQPGSLVGFDGFFPLFVFGIVGDGQNFKSPLFVFCILFFQVGK